MCQTMKRICAGLILGILSAGCSRNLRDEVEDRGTINRFVPVMVISSQPSAGRFPLTVAISAMPFFVDEREITTYTYQPSALYEALGKYLIISRIWVESDINPRELKFEMSVENSGNVVDLKGSRAMLRGEFGSIQLHGLEDQFVGGRSKSRFTLSGPPVEDFYLKARGQERASLQLIVPQGGSTLEFRWDFDYQFENVKLVRKVKVIPREVTASEAIRLTKLARESKSLKTYTIP